MVSSINLAMSFILSLRGGSARCTSPSVRSASPGGSARATEYNPWVGTPFSLDSDQHRVTTMAQLDVLPLHSWIMQALLNDPIDPPNIGKEVFLHVHFAMLTQSQILVYGLIEHTPLPTQLDSIGRSTGA
jgi:hypothetical protein